MEAESEALLKNIEVAVIRILIGVSRTILERKSMDLRNKKYAVQCTNFPI